MFYFCRLIGALIFLIHWNRFQLLDKIYCLMLFFEALGILFFLVSMEWDTNCFYTFIILYFHVHLYSFDLSIQIPFKFEIAKIKTSTECCHQTDKYDDMRQDWDDMGLMEILLELLEWKALWYILLTQSKRPNQLGFLRVTCFLVSIWKEIFGPNFFLCNFFIYLYSLPFIYSLLKGAVRTVR